MEMIYNDNIKQYEIVFCSFYARTNLAEISSIHLEPNVVHGLVNYISIQTNFTNSAKSFYDSLNLDNTSYFTNLLLFENKSMFCCPTTQNIELNF
jgi:hypothetical protein